MNINKIKARCERILKAQESDDGLELPEAIDEFDSTAVDDMLSLIAEVERLQNEIKKMKNWKAT